MCLVAFLLEREFNKFNKTTLRPPVSFLNNDLLSLEIGAGQCQCLAGSLPAQKGWKLRICCLFLKNFNYVSLLECLSVNKNVLKKFFFEEKQPADPNGTNNE